MKMLSSFLLLGVILPLEAPAFGASAGPRFYGDPPDVLAGDAGFSPREDKRKELEDTVDVLAIPRSVADRIKEELVPWHRFRAGVEGTISVLKRSFRLLRCVYRGFNNFATSVGLGILCHNLVLLARLRL